MYPYNINALKSFVLSNYVLNLDGKNRLNLVTPVAATRLQEPPRSTLGALLVDDTLRHTLSEIIYSAFGLWLVVDPTGMQQLQYALSREKPLSADLERSINDSTVQFYGRAIPLEKASDGTKAFTGIIAEVLAGDPEILFIDEPEAFLHPGLQYALGREIGKNLQDPKQIFAATHSPDFLMGCIASGAPIDVVRLTYDGTTSTASLLPSAQLQQMMLDPLLRSVGVLSALFYQNAIIVEGDSDRAFYDEVNNRLVQANEPGIHHAIFLNAHGKHPAVEIARPLRTIGVPTAVILDIDWIKEDGQVTTKYFDGVKLPEGLRLGKSNDRRQTRTYLDTANSNYKRSGGIALLSGQEKQTVEEFFDFMDRYGLFTVRNGEVEAWLSSTGVSRNKSTWLHAIFTAMGSNPNNVDYIRPQTDDVWEFIRKIGRWLNDRNRSGMG